MFGNRWLPNIAPSLLCFLPPPIHIPLPLTNAHMGQARACSLLTPMPTRCTNVTNTPRFPLPSSRDVGKQDATSLPKSPTALLTANDNPHLPRHCWKGLCTPRHNRRRPPPTTSPPKTSAYPTSQMTPTPNYHLIIQKECAHHVMDNNDPLRRHGGGTNKRE